MCLFVCIGSYIYMCTCTCVWVHLCMCIILCVRTCMHVCEYVINAKIYRLETRLGQNMQVSLCMKLHLHDICTHLFSYYSQQSLNLVLCVCLFVPPHYKYCTCCFDRACKNYLKAVIYKLKTTKIGRQ